MSSSSSSLLFFGNYYLIIWYIIAMTIVISETNSTSSELQQQQQQQQEPANDDDETGRSLFENTQFGTLDEINKKLRTSVVNPKDFSHQSLKLKRSIKQKRDASIGKFQDDKPLYLARVTPISLLDLGYYPAAPADEEITYYKEDMDELIQLQKKLDNFNRPNKRGDMHPILDYEDVIRPATSNDEDEVPMRGDLITKRSKRSTTSEYDGDDDDNDYDYEYWGFGEDDGYISGENIDSNESPLSSSTTNNNNNNNNNKGYLPNNDVAEFKSHYERRNLQKSIDPTEASSFSSAQMHQNYYNQELEQKLQDYINHNRPISIQSPVINNLEAQRRNHYSIRNSNKLKDNRRLNNLAVSAQIIILKNASSNTTGAGVNFDTRGNFDDEVKYLGINPNRGGLQATYFPSAVRVTTPKSRLEPPSPCIWAIVKCCTSSDFHRLTRCFEHMGCPGINWDPDPCRQAVSDAAKAEIAKYYGARNFG